MFAYCSGAGSSPIFMHRPNILAYVGKWSFISELANIYIKENTKRCPLCIDLLFLSLKMKLWHITKTSLDFAKIPLCTQWISLRAQAAPSTCSVQRRREQLQLPQPDLFTTLPLEPPTAAGVAVSQNCGGSRRHNSAARAAWTEMGAACGKGKSIQLAFFTFLLSFSSVESWNGDPFWTRAYALNDRDMDTWTYTQTHTCAHTPSHICFTWTAKRAEEYFEVCPSSGFKPTITCCTLGMFFKCRCGVQSRPSWIGLWWWCPGVSIYDRW